MTPYPDFFYVMLINEQQTSLRFSKNQFQPFKSFYDILQNQKK